MASDWQVAGTQNLTPGLLNDIYSRPTQVDPSGNGLYIPFAFDGRNFVARGSWDQAGTGDGGGNASTVGGIGAGGLVGNDRSRWSINEDLGGRLGASYGGDGSYAGHYKSQGPYQDLITAAAFMAGGYYGGNALAGMAGGGAGTAATTGAAAGGAGTAGAGAAGAGAGAAATGAGGSSGAGLGSLFGLGGGGSAAGAAGGAGMWGQLLNTAVGAGLNYAMRPDAPDYQGLQNQQNQQNLQATILNSVLNRPNITSPYGSQTWSMVQDPNAPGGYRVSTDIQLSPEQQALYNQNTQLQLGQGQVAQGLLGQIGQNASQPFDLGGFGDPSRMGQTSRLYEPDGGIHFQQSRQTLGQGPQFQQYGAGPSYQGVGGPELLTRGADGAFELGGNNGPAMGRVGGQGPAARDLYGQQGYEGSRSSVEQAYLRRLERLRESQMLDEGAALDTKLKNMGLTEGTEAYDRELRNLRQSQATERSDWADRAILAGGAEQSRLAGLDLAADAQRFGQQQQGFQNEVTRTGFNNAAGQQEFTNLQTALEQRNRARAAQGAQDAQMTSANNAARLGFAGFDNQWARQGMEDTRTAIDQGNQTAQQGFTNERTTAGFNNDAYNQEWNRYIQALTTDQALRSGRSAEDNALRSQSIQEALMARQLPLTEFNALRTGIQPQLPQTAMGQAGQYNPANPITGAQMGYQAAMGNYNANTALIQQILNSAAGMNWGGAFGLGGQTGQPGGYTPDELSYFYG